MTKRPMFPQPDADAVAASENARLAGCPMYIRWLHPQDR
jgi:hypothetical protein